MSAEFRVPKRATFVARIKAANSKAAKAAQELVGVIDAYVAAVNAATPSGVNTPEARAKWWSVAGVNADLTAILAEGGCASSTSKSYPTGAKIAYSLGIGFEVRLFKLGLSHVLAEVAKGVPIGDIRPRPRPKTGGKAPQAAGGKAPQAVPSEEGTDNAVPRVESAEAGRKWARTQLSAALAFANANARVLDLQTRQALADVAKILGGL